jgi:hypothetical protein
MGSQIRESIHKYQGEEREQSWLSTPISPNQRKWRSNARLVPDVANRSDVAVTHQGYQLFVIQEVKLELVRGFEPRTCALRKPCKSVSYVFASPGASM